MLSSLFMVLASVAFASSQQAVRAPVSVQVPVQVVDGVYCEVIWGTEGASRVSCFELSGASSGDLHLEGSAFSFSRPDRKTKVLRAPELATWRAIEIIPDGPSDKLTYRYLATMTRNGREVEGVSETSFPSDAGPGDGWYMGSEGNRVSYKLVAFEALESCLELSAGEQSRAERFRAVASVPRTSLEACAK